MCQITMYTFIFSVFSPQEDGETDVEEKVKEEKWDTYITVKPERTD